MQEEGVVGWLASVRSSLIELGLQPVALVGLDRPTVVNRVWTDGTLQANQVQDLLATYATELASAGMIDGARLAAPFARQLSTAPDRSLAVLAAPRQAPRIAAILRGVPGTDFSAAMQALESAAPRQDIIEMAASMCEATGAAAVLATPETVDFASKAAFVQQGATGPFLGLSCLSRQASDALARLHKSALDSNATQPMRREQIGGHTLACFVKRIGENNLALAASRFALTRAELSEAESMIAGLSCKESASRLKISPETVRQRRKVIYRKLGVESCGTAVARILELELPPPSTQVAAANVVSPSLDVNRVSQVRPREF